MNEVIISWHLRKDYDCSPGGGDRVGRWEDIPASGCWKEVSQKEKRSLGMFIGLFFLQSWLSSLDLRGPEKGAVQVLFPLSSTIIRGLLLRWEHQDDFLWIRSFGWTWRDSPDPWTPSGQVPHPPYMCSHRSIACTRAPGWGSKQGLKYILPAIC